MKTIFVVTFVDLVNVGYNPSKVKIFDTKEEASEHIKKQYLEKCEVEGIPENERFAMDTIEHEVADKYAYIFGKYYWDCFEEEINGEK